MKKSNRLVVFALASVACITSCKKAEDPQQDTTTPTTTANPFAAGVFITNEGPFSSGTGTVSFFNRSGNVVQNDIFASVNSRPLGNIVQSMAINNGKGYLVVNNAGKVEVVTADDFKSVGSITGLTHPRYFLGIDNAKGYVSQWGSVSSSIAVVDLSNNTITKTIPTGSGPERMIKAGTKVFVINSGGYGSHNSITVIDAQTDNVLTTVTVGDSPNSIQLDANNKLWVLCGGKKVYDVNYAIDTAQSTAGKLLRIDPATNAIELSVSFKSKSLSPSHLVVNTSKNKLYYTYSYTTYEMDITSTTLNTTAFINKDFYGMDVDPVSGYLYGSDPLDYQKNGYVYRYNLTTGAKVDSFKVGIIPGNFCFR